MTKPSLLCLKIQSYRAVNTLHLGYKDHLLMLGVVNLFWNIFKNRKYTLITEYKNLIIKSEATYSNR